MSDLRKTIQSDLPENIEEQIKRVHEKISLLERRDIELNQSIEEKTNIEKSLEEKISALMKDSELLESNILVRVKDLDDREIRINQKESALNTYANALTEKENKINKYLAVFESMKKISTI